MDTERKKYLFVIKESYVDKYGQYIGAIHYEKDLTDSELYEEVNNIQSKRPIKFGYMEISGTITYQGLIRVGLVDVKGGKMWYAWDEDNGVSRYFHTKKECGDFIKANFKGEYRKACLMLLAHDTGRAKVNL